MDENFQTFDWHRIFVGDAPIIFLAEIVVRTVIMYAYTTILLRVLGKRGLGQLSTLELAILISFGSAVGDPMIYGDIPVTYGMVAITVIAGMQIGLEHIINSNKKVEKIMDGEPNLVIENGIMLHDNMKKDNISKEDLFRFLRLKEVTHLGQISKAYFETSGQVSVVFLPGDQVKPGLSVIPDPLIQERLFDRGVKLKEEALYMCFQCGYSQHFQKDESITACIKCHGDKWIKTS